MNRTIFQNYSYITALEKLKTIRQEHLLQDWDKLLQWQQDALIQQSLNLNTELFLQQQQCITQVTKNSLLNCSPYQQYHISGENRRQQRGNNLIKEGRVACLLIAGGQGSRLDFNQSKGCFPISNIKNKSLFQLHAEKIVAASKQIKRDILLAVMTSSDNHQQTIDFFQENHFFGLKKQQVSFFFQQSLPLLDESHNLFLKNTHEMATGPDGNGNSLQCFFNSGIWDQWQQLGVRYFTFTLVDNPLADPLDSELCGLCEESNSDVVIKAVEKTCPEEKVGLIVSINGKLSIIEYSEMPPQDLFSEKNKRLKYHLANTSLFCFNMDFVKTAAKITLPQHIAHKIGTKWQKDRLTQTNIFKFETFIFDLLQISSKHTLLLCPRELCFAPLKNKTGPDSPNSVRQALHQKDKHILRKIISYPLPRKLFELAPEFYYPSKDLLKKWHSKVPPKEGYILS